MVLCSFDVQIDSIFNTEPNQDIFDDFYLRLEQALADSASITLQPVSTLKENLKMVFGNFGYPRVKGKRAAKSKASDSYLKAKIELTTLGIMTGGQDQIGTADILLNKNKQKVKVRVITDITVYDGKGSKVRDFKVQAATKDKVTFTSKTFDIGGFVIAQGDKAENENMAILEELITDSFAQAARKLR